jgi:Na+-transporting NADH:ubiquinone oxidoreductase subunit F
MTTVILGVVVFVLVVVALVIILMVAKSKLVSSADVKITVNDDPDKAITTPAGDTLLNTLSNNKIFIPSACGGKGTLRRLQGRCPRGGGRAAAH